ncbi:MAG: hypothetical protein IPK82_43795 [Polyangiaceae bacterium]|nr:hypothetical protein [Polyangiaceae bacterium]
MSLNFQFQTAGALRRTQGPSWLASIVDCGKKAPKAKSCGDSSCDVYTEYFVFETTSPLGPLCNSTLRGGC